MNKNVGLIRHVFASVIEQVLRQLLGCTPKSWKWYTFCMDADELRETLHEHDFEDPHRGPHIDKQAPSTHQPGLSQDQTHPKPQNPQALFSWVAPLRAYKQQTVGVLRFYVAVAVLLTLIVFFFKEFILIIPIWAIMFLVYALTITPPENTEHIITKFGIQTAQQTYPWENLSHFYFIKKFDYDIVVIFTRMQFTHPLYLVVPNPPTKHEVLHHLSNHLIYQESPRKTLTDKMAEWLTTLMPEEAPPKGDTANQQAEHPVHGAGHEGSPPSHQTFAPTEVRLHPQ